MTSQATTQQNQATNSPTTFKDKLDVAIKLIMIRAIDMDVLYCIGMLELNSLEDLIDSTVPRSDTNVPKDKTWYLLQSQL
jgi:hypothetical protein